MLSLFGECFLDFRCLVPDVRRGIDLVQRRGQLFLHPGPLLDVPGREEHLQFRYPANADQGTNDQRLQFRTDGRKMESCEGALVG